MKISKFLILVFFTFCFYSCTIKERIVFNEDGSGSYLMSYEMGEFMKQMKSKMGDNGASDGKKGKVMDTTIVFKDIMETYKDSVAALSEDKRMAMEAVKDMYMKMTMDEEKGDFNFGIGLNFKSVRDLDNIGEKLKKAKSLNAQNDQVDAMKGSQIGKFMGDDNYDCSYEYNESGFTRSTELSENWTAGELKFDENDETDKEFISYFENAFYTVEYTFPKPIKSYSIESAQLSNNNKTISYKVSWLDFLVNPKLLDVNLVFADE